ncbi:outer membrane protein assembly factor BamB family protein [Microbispora bryophytorum]|uniref:Pyrrolo-quinoline quinone repeat domain-containing protein n=1 Tax=Microbispora bryophytorum TaxID=1460882 RepID=A0A8H9L943_9ACTN|nr:PQQ-binding-like beta-propeller repeat protein [Microbispora bryophytorum]MBD3135691.1 PQQ-like beta-propeller repeat protein [Microbispora bryophytorum]TQS09858.1 PQQ-binding-like beta-propeller repeat protein [Microbispora bryophytorum]GGN98951.1 hypothetical protein GCM10011574_04050 [Microbispora bryophytorum]
MLTGVRPLAAFALLAAVLTAAAPDATTGREFTRAWVTDVPAGFAAPGVLAVDDDLLLRDGTSVSALDPRTGAARWRHVFTRSIPTDWVASGAALVSRSGGPTPKGDTTYLTGLSRADGTVRWERAGIDGAGTWRGPYGGGRVAAIPAWDGTRREIVGLSPESGSSKWTARLPGGCDRVMSSGSATVAVVFLARCADGDRLLARDPETGAPRWSAEVGHGTDLQVDGNSVVQVHDYRLTVYDATTGRTVVERAGCWDACAYAVVADLLVLAYSAGSDEVIEAFDPTRGSTRWVHRQPGSAGRYTRLLIAGDRLYGVLDAGQPAAVDIIDPKSGTGRRSRLPLPGDPVAAVGSLLLTARYADGVGQAARLRVAAFERDDGAMEHGPTDGWRARSACDLLAAEDLTTLGPAYRSIPDDLPSAAGCRYAGKGMEIEVRVWTEPSARLAEELLGEFKNMTGGVRTSALADGNFTSGADTRAVYAREGRTVIRVSSAYIPLRGHLRAMARAAVGRVDGSAVTYEPSPLAWRADTAAAPAGDVFVTLPGTSVTIHEPPGSPLTLAAYNPFFDGPTRLRQNPGGVFSSTASRYTSLSPNGRWGLILPDHPPKKGGYAVSLTDLRTGRILKRTLPVAASRRVTAPFWSSDSGRLLFTVRSTDAQVGFVTMDVPSGKSTFVSTYADEDVGEFDVFWSRDETGVVSAFGVEESENQDEDDTSYDTYALRLMDMSGRSTGTIDNVGDPDLGMPDPYSPSRSRFVTHCPRRWDALCVTDAVTGTPLIRIDLYTERLLGWYDDDHLVVWRRENGGYRADVVDFSGAVVGRLADSTSERESDAELFYIRQPPL